LRSILFGHRRGAFPDAREDRPGLVAAAGKGVLLLDDLHRLPVSCSAVLHSFLEDGEYSRLGEEEVRRHAEAAAVLTVETGPWSHCRRSGALPPAFLARVERLPLTVPPLRERPEDIEAQAMWLTRVVSAEVGADIELTADAIAHLCEQPFSASNSRDLRNAVERTIYRHYRETERLEWSHLRPFLLPVEPPADRSAELSNARGSTAAIPVPQPVLNEWQRRLRSLAAKILAKGSPLPADQVEEVVAALFERTLPSLWPALEAGRAVHPTVPPVPLPIWEDLWRCFAVSWLGGPAPAEKVLGIPANTLRQWINDREGR
jgi:transcriptional regulator with AAA-type ATPase domain